MRAAVAPPTYGLGDGDSDGDSPQIEKPSVGRLLWLGIRAARDEFARVPAHALFGLLMRHNREASAVSGVAGTGRLHSRRAAAAVWLHLINKTKLLKLNREAADVFAGLSR